MLGSVLGQLSQQLVFRFQLHIFIVMNTVFKNVEVPVSWWGLAVEAEWEAASTLLFVNPFALWGSCLSLPCRGSG